MTALHEVEVRARFDLLHGRFKREVASTDVRLRAVRAVLGPLQGKRILDLGCGKGRFSSRLVSERAHVVGLDISHAMLAEAPDLNRVRGTASRLPFSDQAFNCVVAIELFEHLPDVERALVEVRRVLKPGGIVAIVDKNAGSWNDRRPWLPNLAVKWIDERRGRWMYPPESPVRERWFWTGGMRNVMKRLFIDVRVAHLLSPTEAEHLLFRRVPGARLFTMWSARVPGGSR